MHDYSIDRHPKEKILFFLAFAAIAAAPYINKLFAFAAEELKIGLSWVTAPALAIPTFTLFIGVYWIFNKYLWKVPWLRSVLLVPDLNGKWLCTGKTVVKDGKEADFPWEGEITITQSWSKILICLKTAQSSSKSISASIYHSEGAGYTLLYQFANDPRADQLELHKHTGAAEITVRDEVSGDGHYFTDRHRKTVGLMHIRKEIK